MLFDNQKITVNMNGKEFMEYERYRKEKGIRIPKKLKEALPYFIFALLGILIIAALISDLDYEKPLSMEEQFYGNSYNLKDYTWNEIAKYSVIKMSPIIVICILIAWVIHGVGFHVIKR
ncbi:MAG: hypothetical protein R6U52_01440 [Kosmotogaceae bacterium]